MNRAGIFIAGCMLSSAVFAANEYGKNEHAVHVRDSQAQLIAAMGEPTRKVEVANSRGDHMGDYFIYELQTESVRFYIEKERVVDITVIAGH